MNMMAAISFFEQLLTCSLWPNPAAPCLLRCLLPAVWVFLLRLQAAVPWWCFWYLSQPLQ